MTIEAAPVPSAVPSGTRALPVLYTFRRCPYAIRARMALRYAGIDVEERQVSLREKPLSLLAISAKATVPVLQLVDGAVLDQSLDIMRWAISQCDPDGWLLADPEEASRWAHLNDEIFKPLLDRYKYADRYPELSRSEHSESALTQFLRPLDRQLEASAYMLGSRISWVDVAVFPFVRQFAAVDSIAFGALPLHGVQRWLEAWLSTELFASAMQKMSTGAD